LRPANRFDLSQRRQRDGIASRKHLKIPTCPKNESSWGHHH
jgi:hypothetical protein